MYKDEKILDAILKNGLRIYRHAIFDADRNIVGYELLSRLLVEEQTVLPGNFLWVFDKVNLPMFYQTLLAGARQLLGKYTHITVFVNLSEHELNNGFYDHLIEHIDPGDMHRLCLEISENIKITAEIREKIKLFKKLGCQIAIDDFGVAHSNFSNFLNSSLKNDIDVIKFDGIFFKDDNAKTLRHVMNAFRKMGKRIVIEYVSDQSRFEEAKAYGFDRFQGFWLAEPELEFASTPYAHLANTMKKMDRVDIDLIESAVDRTLKITNRVLKNKKGAVKEAYGVLRRERIADRDFMLRVFRQNNSKMYESLYEHLEPFDAEFFFAKFMLPQFKRIFFRACGHDHFLKSKISAEVDKVRYIFKKRSERHVLTVKKDAEIKLHKMLEFSIADMVGNFAMYPRSIMRAACKEKSIGPEKAERSLRYFDMMMEDMEFYNTVLNKPALSLREIKKAVEMIFMVYFKDRFRLAVSGCEHCDGGKVDAQILIALSQVLDYLDKTNVKRASIGLNQNSVMVRFTENCASVCTLEKSTCVAARFKKNMNRVLSGGVLEFERNVDGKGDFIQITQKEKNMNNVIILDDDIMLLEHLKDELEMEDIGNKTFSSPLEFFKETEGIDLSSSYSALVIDFSMPEMNGIEVIRKLKRKYRGTKPHLVIFSANANQIFENEAYREIIEGFQISVVKKPNVEELISRLTKGVVYA